MDEDIGEVVDGDIPEHNRTRGPVAQLRAELLKATVEHAVKYSSFYRKYGARKGFAHFTLDDLGQLPIIDKQVLQEHGDEMVTSQQMPEFIQLTGGTLRLPTLKYRSWEESEVNSQRNGIIERILNARRRLCLKILVPMNGIGFHVLGAPTVTVPLVLEKHFRLIHGLLKREFAFRDYEARISTIISGLDRLKLLTAYFLEQGIDFSQFNVSTIFTSATYLSSRWKKTLSEAWGALIIDQFGLSETAGGLATYCYSCAGYHFDPAVVAEVISLESRKPVSKGLGILVLTSLYPLVQLQPLIRYWTDDIVEVGPQCKRVNDISIKLKGRRAHSVTHEVDGTTAYLLLSTDVVEALDGLTDVAIESDPLIEGLKSQDVGYHKWAVEMEVRQGRPVLRLKVELKYSPALFQERLPALKAHLVNCLKERNPTFQEMLTTGGLDFSIDFLPPDTLPSVIV